jgi:MoaA/NifB/PqqE/SkfB family radical SAM enzyme
MTITPERISIEISTACNLGCGMCFLTGLRQGKILRKNDYLNKFFDVDLFKKLIDELSENHLLGEKSSPFSLSFTGGEPFLHPHIFDLLRYAREKKVGVTVYTNGTLINPLFSRKICEVMPEALMFSVDGPEEVHDKIRGKGNFKKTYEAIESIQSQKGVLTAKVPRIYINTVINNLNVDYLQEILSMAEFLNIDGISFSHLQWSDSRLTSLAENEFKTRLNWAGFHKSQSTAIKAFEHNLAIIAKDKIEKLVSQINLIKERYKYSCLPQAISMPRFSPFRPDLSEQEIKLWYGKEYSKINFCDWVYKWIKIGINGDIQPICGVIPFSAGNLKEKSLKEILSCKEIRNFFDEIKNNGFFYVCQHCCRRPSKSSTIR